MREAKCMREVHKQHYACALKIASEKCTTDFKPGISWAESEYLVHTISVQCLLLDGTTLDSVVRSTAMRRTPPNTSEHRRNSTGCLEMTYLPSDAGKITLISYLFSVLSSLLLN